MEKALPDPRSFDLTTEHPETHAFIQWKGTDVCFDFRCDCGEEGHFDGYFAYVVKCTGCGQDWEMPALLFPRKSERSDGMTPVECERDDDEKAA